MQIGFYTTIFGFLLIASIATIFNSIFKRVSGEDDSLIYVSQACLIFALVLNDILSSISIYREPGHEPSSLVFLMDLTFFVLYTGCLIAIVPNQRALNISADVLKEDSSKRILFWTFFSFVSILSFLWNVAIYDFTWLFTVIFIFVMAGIGGITVEMLNKNIGEKNHQRRKVIDRYNYFVCILAISYIIIIQILYAPS